GDDVGDAEEVDDVQVENEKAEDDDDDDDDDVDEWEEEDDFDEGEIPLPPTMSSFRRLGNTFGADVLPGDTSTPSAQPSRSQPPMQSKPKPQPHRAETRKELLPGPTRDEYERTIRKLEKLNATLTANVAALYAENAAVSSAAAAFSASASVSSSSSSLRHLPDHQNHIDDIEEQDQEDEADEEDDEEENEERRNANFVGRKRVTMELTPNEEYCHYYGDVGSAAVLEGDQHRLSQNPLQQPLAETHELMDEDPSSSPYTRQYFMKLLSKSEKSNEKLKKQLASQKKLVGQLSVNLKVAAEKIMELNAALNGTSDGWHRPKNDHDPPNNDTNHSHRTRNEQTVPTSEKGINTDPVIYYDDRHIVMERRLHHLQHRCQTQQHEYQTYQTHHRRHIREIRAQLQSLSILLSDNSRAHDDVRERLLSEMKYCGNGDGDGWNATNTAMFAKMETPEEIMQRVIRNLRQDAMNGAVDGGGDGGCGDAGEALAGNKTTVVSNNYNNTASAMDFCGLRIGDGVAGIVETKSGATDAEDNDDTNEAERDGAEANDNGNGDDDDDEQSSGSNHFNDSSHHETEVQRTERDAVIHGVLHDDVVDDVVDDDDRKEDMRIAADEGISATEIHREGIPPGQGSDDSAFDDDGRMDAVTNEDDGFSGQLVDENHVDLSLSIPNLDEEVADDSNSDGRFQMGQAISGDDSEADSYAEGNDNSDARNDCDIESDDDLEEPNGNVIYKDQCMGEDDDDSCIQYGARAQDPRYSSEMDDDSEESLPREANIVSPMENEPNDDNDYALEIGNQVDTANRARDPLDLGSDDDGDNNDACDEDLVDLPAHRSVCFDGPDSAKERCNIESDDSVENESRAELDIGEDEDQIVDQDNQPYNEDNFSPIDTRGVEPDRDDHGSMIDEMDDGHENSDENGSLGDHDSRREESDDDSNVPMADDAIESSETVRGRGIGQHCDETSSIDANSNKLAGQTIPIEADESSSIHERLNEEDNNHHDDISEKLNNEPSPGTQPLTDAPSRDDESQNGTNHRFADDDDQSIESVEPDSNIHTVGIDRGSFDPDEMSESDHEQVNTSLLQSDRDLDVPYGKKVQSFHSEGIDSCMEEVNTYLLKTDEDSYGVDEVHNTRDAVDHNEMTQPLPKKGIEIGIQVGKGLCDGDVTLDGKYPIDPKKYFEEQNPAVPVEIIPDGDGSKNHGTSKLADDFGDDNRREIDPQSGTRHSMSIHDVANTTRVEEENDKGKNHSVGNIDETIVVEADCQNDALIETEESSKSGTRQMNGITPPETEECPEDSSDVSDNSRAPRDADSNEYDSQNDERSQIQVSVSSEEPRQYRSPQSYVAAAAVLSRMNDENSSDSPIVSRIRRNVCAGKSEDNSDVVMDLYDESDDEFAAQNEDQPGEDDYVAKEGKDTDGVCSVVSGAFGEDESIDSGSYKGLNGVPAYINAEGMTISDSGTKNLSNTPLPSSTSGSQVGGASSVQDSVKKFNEKLERKMAQARDDKSMKSWTMSTVYTNETKDISVYSKSAFSKLNKDDPLSTRLSRKQLFQQAGSSCKNFFPDHNNVDNVEKDHQSRTVLVRARDKKSLVPPYKPPNLPEIKSEDSPIFSKDKGDGYFIYKSSSGNEYRGYWKDGRRHGQGLAKYRDGEVYTGEWKRGRRHGRGVLHLANSEVFDGGWDANKKHGLGIYFWADGEADVSWYEYDQRKESIRWTKDRRRSYRLDLASSRKDQISLTEAAKIVKRWQRKSLSHD
ncbi:hypothetical protein ACHAXS_007031, partial [Conticribra weissflogii]